MRYQQIKRLAAEHPVAGLGQMPAVSRSGYYDWRERGSSRRQQEDAQLAGELEQALLKVGKPMAGHGSPIVFAKRATT
jgi:hypothetical protein